MYIHAGFQFINWADYITLDDAVRQLSVIRLQTAIYCTQLIPLCLVLKHTYNHHLTIQPWTI